MTDVVGPRVAVVGAGHAGLSVVAELNARGVVPLVFDPRPIGATWTNRYRALRLNTQASMSGVPHCPVPEEFPEWPSGAQWASYLRDASMKLEFDRIEDRVSSVRRVDSGWIVDTDSVPYEVDHTVVTTGRHRVPQLPPWAIGAGSGVHHAADFKDPVSYTNHRVLVVGGGNSGTEIAHLLVGHARTVTISVRTRPLFVQRSTLGIGLTRAGALARRAPDWLLTRAGPLLQRAVFGDLADLGLGPPEGSLVDLQSSGPTVDEGFIADVKAGRITVAPEVIDAGDSCVDFSSSDRRSFDSVICATGYRPGLDALLGEDYLDDKGWPRPAADASAGLHFAGFGPATLTAFLPDFRVEARAIAESIVE